MIISGMKETPADSILEYVYYEAVRHHKALTEDIAHYDRQEDDSPDHTFKYLFEAVERANRLWRQRKMREDLARGYSNKA